MKTEIGQIQKEIGAEQKATAQAQRNGGKIAGKVESMQKNIDVGIVVLALVVGYIEVIGRT